MTVLIAFKKWQVTLSLIAATCVIPGSQSWAALLLYLMLSQTTMADWSHCSPSLGPLYHYWYCYLHSLAAFCVLHMTSCCTPSHISTTTMSLASLAAAASHGHFSLLFGCCVEARPARKLTANWLPAANTCGGGGVRK